jgi:GAF domain-containing protein
MVINDILQDERFADLPFGNARFYAGCPVRIPFGDGEKAIGSLCIIDYKPRDLNEDEMKLLNDFAAMVRREIMDTHPPR